MDRNSKKKKKLEKGWSEEKDLHLNFTTFFIVTKFFQNNSILMVRLKYKKSLKTLFAPIHPIELLYR